MVEVLCNAIVIWGINNTVYSSTKVQTGYKFYAAGAAGSGAWHDVLPLHHVENNQYFRHIGNPMQELGYSPSGDELIADNWKAGFTLKELRRKDDKSFNWKKILYTPSAELLSGLD